MAKIVKTEYPFIPSRARLDNHWLSLSYDSI